MRKFLVIGSLCATLAIALFAAMSESELEKRMKSVGEHQGALRKSMAAADLPGVATHAQGIHDALMGTEDFWSEHKSEEGVKFTKDALAASAALAAAAKSGNADDTKAAAGKMGATCKGCHTKHREQVSEGKYKIKGL